MPVPRSGETRKKFISRCIPIVLHEGTTDDPKQAAAICHSIWRKKHPGAKAERHSGIQSLRFSKKKFDRAKAVSWAKSHGFKSNNVEEMPNEYRLRQFPPKKCISSGGMKDLAPGVRGYVCPTAGANPAKSYDLLLESLDRISISLDILKSKL